MEEVRRAAGATVFSLVFNSIFTLWVLFSFNQVRDRFKRKSDGTSSLFFLDTKELLTIYIMVNMVTALCSYGMLPILLPVVTCAFWGATPENEWRTLFHHDLPFWLTVTQPKALTDYYQGDASLYSRWNLEAWLIPLCWWSLFTFVLVVVMLCVDIIVCQQWVKREKLAYPIAEIPLNLVRPHFYNRLMWIGFAMAVTINLVNGLHMLFPQMPELTFFKRQHIGHIFTNKPWNSLRAMRIAFIPSIIELSFFMPLDLLFSCCFFYFYWLRITNTGIYAGMANLPSLRSTRLYRARICWCLHGNFSLSHLARKALLLANFYPASRWTAKQRGNTLSHGLDWDRTGPEFSHSLRLVGWNVDCCIRYLFSLFLRPFHGYYAVAC